MHTTNTTSPTTTSPADSTATTTDPPSSHPPSTSTSSTSLSSQRFPFLHETSSNPILLWRSRSMHTTFSTPRDLCRELDAASARGKSFRCARIPIPRGCSRVDVHVRDTYEEPMRSRYRMYPNQDSSIASVGLPRGVWLRRLILGQFSDWYVVSPESSPGSSPGGSGSAAGNAR